ncbi:MAG TPA: cyclophane-forming radical SAM/SPASM peptide maturase GrrM/OscB [Croceibacterium sp.]
MQLLIIQSTTFCNIDCSYCYLPLRSSKSRFDLELIPLLVQKLSDADLLDRQLSVAWHAGEPLVLPSAYYRSAMDLFSTHIPEGVEARHAFQTNAILLTDEYADFFLETGSMVGVSIDGPAELHDARRRTRDGKGTHERAMAGVRRLRDRGIRPSCISVLTAQSLERPDEIYDFFKDLGVSQAGFNIEEIEGVNASSSLSPPEMYERVRAFFARLHERAAADPEPLRIRELEQAKGAAIGGLLGAVGGSNENNPLSIISVDSDGRISSFSPELLQVPGETDIYTFGDVRSIDFTTLWQNNRFVDINGQIQSGVARCKAECGYFDACHGGAPANKLAENGTFDSTETMHCRLAKQALLDALEDAMVTQLQKQRQRRLVAREAKLAAAASIPASDAPAPRVVMGRSGGGAIGRASTVLDSSTAQALFKKRPSADPASPSGQTSPFPHLGSINIFAPLDRIQVNHGTCLVEAGTRGYNPAAVLPRDDWRPCTPEEWAAFHSPARSPGPLNYVALIRLPAELQRLAAELGAGVTLAKPSGRGSPDGEFEAEHRLQAGIRELFGDTDAFCPLGIMLQDAGQKTTTVDEADGLRLGLHVDSWTKSRGDKRAGAINRIAVNLGEHPRRLLLLDLGVDQLMNLVRSTSDPRPELRNPTEIARQFLFRFPDYPVVSIQVLPGEAYIAPTENLVHDGCSSGSTGRDVVFTILGQFTRDRSAAFTVQDGLESV